MKSIAIEPTNSCNLKCNVCYTRSGGRPQGFMDMGLFERVVDEAMRLQVRRLGLNFGGEPLLHPQFKTMLSYIAKYNFPKVSFTTNGTMLTDELIAIITSGGMVDAIGISAHQELEKVKSSVKKLIANRKTSNKPRIGISINLGEYGNRVNEVIEFWKDIPCSVAVVPTIENMKWTNIPRGSVWKTFPSCSFVNRYIYLVGWKHSYLLSRYWWENCQNVSWKKNDVRGLEVKRICKSTKIYDRMWVS